MNARISKGGQISIPAAVRHRWATDRVQIEDEGTRLVIRPIPADPIAEAVGSIQLPPAVTSERMRAEGREEEQMAETRGDARR